MSQSAGPRRLRKTGEGWQVGRLLGVPVILTRSWFLVAAVITVFFGQAVERSSPGLGAAAYLVAFVFAVLLLLSVLVHELGHALVARATGTPASRIVLNLWGGHTQFESEAATPGRSLAIAAVGPVTNGVVAVLAWLALPAVPADGVVRLLLYALAFTNAFVSVFNLVPGLPLDGGRVLEALVWKLTGDRSRGMAVAGWVGRAFAVGVVVWVILRPLVLGLRPDIVSVVWSAMIGGLLWQGAGEAVRVAGVRRRMESTSAAGLAVPAVAVPATATVADATANGIRRSGAEVVLVTPDGVPLGVLDRDAADAVPPDRRDVVHAVSTARALPRGAVLDVRLEGRELLEALSHLPGEEWVAVDERGQIVGVLRSAAVVAALQPPRR